MAHRTLIHIVSAAALLVLAASPTALAGEDAKAAVEAVDAKMMAALAAKDAKAAGALYAPDAVFAASGFGTAKGPEAIMTALSTFMSDPTFTVKITSTDFQVDPNGSIAYLVAGYEMTQTPPGAAGLVTAKGTNVTVYRKDASGNWQITADMNIDDPAPAN